MKITISKQQWQLIGKKTGWIKKIAAYAEEYKKIDKNSPLLNEANKSFVSELDSKFNIIELLFHKNADNSSTIFLFFKSKTNKGLIGKELQYFSSMCDKIWGGVYADSKDVFEVIFDN